MPITAVNAVGVSDATISDGATAIGGTVYAAGQVVFELTNSVYIDAGNIAVVGGGGGDLLAANNLSDLANVATARTNLGLGTAAVAASGDFAAASHNHAAGDVTSGTFADARIAQSSVSQHIGALGSQIKTAYEGETDTNAFTDAEKTKLAGLLGGLNKLDATAAPTINDDGADTSGNGVFSVGSVWIDTTNDEAYRCIDATTGAAVWVNTTLDASDLAAIAISGSWNDLLSTPTTLAGYGITDAINVSAIGVTVQAYDADTAKLDVAQVWTASQRSSVNSNTFAATLADDTSGGPMKQKVTVTADVTSFTLTNGSEGQSRIWYFLQDGTGGHTITFSGIDGTAPTIDTAADALTVVEFEYVAGTGWRFV